MRTLPKRFYARSALKVAPDLLGKILSCRRRGVLVEGRIVEVEAYLGSQDPASHAFGGTTKRNAPMFGPPGRAYVYFTYGNHFCMNVVTETDGKAGAVLIRALEPVSGVSAMKRRRKKVRITDLTSGPGKLTQALSIDRSLNGADLSGPVLKIRSDPAMGKIKWIRTPRIGISEGRKLPFRFLIPTSSFVSKTKPSA